jgi:hypothetical protein
LLSQVFNAVLSSLLGKVIDKDWTNKRSITTALTQVGGIQFSVGCGIILLASLIPAGAFSLNPKVINSMPLQGEEGDANLGLEKGEGASDKENAFNKNSLDGEYAAKEQRL